MGRNGWRQQIGARDKIGKGGIRSDDAAAAATDRSENGTAGDSLMITAAAIYCCGSCKAGTSEMAR